MRFSGFLLSTTLIASLPGLAGAQDASEAARVLLVEAIRAAQQAQEADSPSERAELLGDAIEALNEIESQYVTTDTGINLISGGTFGAFDPSAVRAEYDAAQAEAELASCETTYSVRCTYRLRNESYAAYDGSTVEEVIEQSGPLDRLLFAAATGEAEEEFPEIVQDMSVDRVFEGIRLLYGNGYSIEMLDLYDLAREALPEIQSEIQDREEFIEYLDRIIDGRNAVQTPERQHSLQRLIDADIEGLDQFILGKGSPEQIAALVRDQDDIETALSDWLASGWISPGSDGSVYVAAALEAAGQSDLAFDLLSNVPPERFDSIFWTAPGKVSADFLASLARDAVSRAEDADEKVTRAMSLIEWVDADQAAEIIEVAAQDSRSADRAEQYGNLARRVGFEAGRQGSEDKLDLVTEEKRDFFKDGEVAAFTSGFAAGQLSAEEASGDAFEEELASATGDELYSLVLLAASGLVDAGLRENAISGINETGVIDDRSVSVADKAKLGAVVGDLQWLAEGARTDEVPGYNLDFVMDEYKDFLIAATEHGFDLSDQPEQIAGVLRSSEDGYFKERFLDEIVSSDYHGYPGFGELMFQAMQYLDGDDRAWTLGAAHRAAITRR
ncbi:hypothetical protein ATO8_20194 [Roseivivax marinus]|uniref:Lipoprotein n=1 Tax=Roseivivax marinus TaxID=1379903 RepID=W4HDE7_9RHOB|nr:hypothetical protein [Roseivivax marinus]ETW10812.1 hypothetical protein ATO8_20194 [Roseivivax marinus]